MYKVAICEDAAVFRLEQETICREILDKLNIENHISAFETGTDLWAAFSGGARFDFLLLDIVMDELNGMELARKIRETDAAVAIVFITANPEYALQGYEVGALHYLIKPLNGNTLEKIIEADYRRRFLQSYMFVKSGTHSIRLSLDDIIYIEAVGKRVMITTKDHAIEASAKLSEMLESLPKEHFRRCHVGYIVNLNNIREITRTDAIAMNRQAIPISRSYFKEVEKAFLKLIWGV